MLLLWVVDRQVRRCTVYLASSSVYQVLLGSTGWVCGALICLVFLYFPGVKVVFYVIFYGCWSSCSWESVFIRSPAIYTTTSELNKFDCFLYLWELNEFDCFCICGTYCLNLIVSCICGICMTTWELNEFYCFCICWTYRLFSSQMYTLDMTPVWFSRYIGCSPCQTTSLCPLQKKTSLCLMCHGLKP
jgi:hypothetical protein